MNAWKKVLFFIAVLLLLVSAIFVSYVQSKNSSWQRYRAELVAKGEPLTFKDVQALRSPQPATNTVAEVVTRVAEAIEKAKDRIPHGIYGLRDGPKINFFDGLYADTIELSREYLSKRLPILKELDVIESLEPGRFALDYDRPIPDIFDSYLDNLPAIRPVTRLIHLHATLHLIDGNLEAATELIPKMLKVVSPLTDEPSLVAHLIQIAVSDIAIQTLENLLRISTVDDASLKQLDKALASYISSHSVKWALWGERAIFIELCEHMKTGAGVNGVAMSAVLTLERQHGTDLLTQLIDASHDPISLCIENRSVKKKQLSLPKTHIFTGMYLPSLPRFSELHLKNLTDMYAARMAIAAERFRLVEGRLPESLDQLVPLYLAEIPIDPFDALSMKFARNESGIIIYSVAEDGVDDGGLVARDKDHKRALDCGFRLFDFDKRGLVILEGEEDK